MNAKNKFREGWIMLLRPFRFAELEHPLQKMTILYAYSEKPIIKMELTDEGKELLQEAYDNIGKEFGLLTSASNIWRRGLGEQNDDRYDERISKQIDALWKQHGTQENYSGEIVQCHVKGILCRFYPDEYSIISRETFEHILSCDEQEYKLEVEQSNFFDSKNIKDRIFYIQTRGINKTLAMKMASKEAKDAVIFRPQPAVLEIFCRDHEIY